MESNPGEQKKWFEEVEEARRASHSYQIQTVLPASEMAPVVPSPTVDLRNGAKIVLWVAVLAILTVIIMNLRANLWSHSRSRKLEQSKEQAVQVKATAARMDKAQLEADDLAKQGDFKEAMHLLLLQSVNELRRRLDISIGISLTSREILYRVGLPVEGQHCFAEIIRHVEISYFGDHQPEQAEYQHCRNNFEQLSLLLQRSASCE